MRITPAHFHNACVAANAHSANARARKQRLGVRRYPRGASRRCKTINMALYCGLIAARIITRLYLLRVAAERGAERHTCC